jgi:type II secretory pathway component GspD/PulD (secretin)
MTQFPSPVRRAVFTAVAVMTTCAAFHTPRILAQDSPAKPTAPREPQLTQTIFLKNITDRVDFSDITTDLRNVLPGAKIYGISSQNSITIRATEEEMQQAQKLIADLDHPRKVYRVTFTITESESGRKTGTQHYSMVISGENKSWIKQGDRVPIVTGSFEKDSSNANTQIQYLDVGINIEASIGGVGLRTKIEQSSVADEKSNVGIQDPIVRQTTLEAVSTFMPGKPIAIGSIDIPGTTRHQDIEAIAELE